MIEKKYVEDKELLEEYHSALGINEKNKQAEYVRERKRTIGVTGVMCSSQRTSNNWKVKEHESLSGIIWIPNDYEAQALVLALYV